MSYLMSIQPDASLTRIGWAAPAATVFGILMCLAYYIHMNRQSAKVRQRQRNDEKQSRKAGEVNR